jgi:NAD+ synthase
MNTQAVAAHITSWLKEYVQNSKTTGFVVGVSGGVDSALTATLCARTGLETILLEMPIHQAESQVSRAQEQIAFLKKNFSNVSDCRVDLTETFETMLTALPATEVTDAVFLARANTRARLRMTTLFYFAGLHRKVVAGTGNKIEDFGVGFYTKYGDGGVDLSPIADLTKTEVFAVAKEVGVVSSILQAKPTDGLWGDDRSDEDQLGASYPELEWAMGWLQERYGEEVPHISVDFSTLTQLSERERQVLAIYHRLHKANRHKMDPIPVCLIPEALKV